MQLLVYHHLAVADPFSVGATAVHVGLMTSATRGWQFPWIAGGVALLRRELYPTPGVWQYCGIAVAGETTVVNYPGMGHTAGQGYQYAACSFLGNGMMSRMCPAVRVDFDGGGDRITPPLPAWPIHAVAEPIAGGRFSVVFEYDAEGEGGPPADFQVFEGATPDTVDYDTALTDPVTGLDYVAFSGGQRVYRFTTPGYADGTAHVFGARGRNSGAVAEKNTLTTISKVATDANPAEAVAERIYGMTYSRQGA